MDKLPPPARAPVWRVAFFFLRVYVKVKRLGVMEKPQSITAESGRAKGNNMRQGEDPRQICVFQMPPWIRWLKITRRNWKCFTQKMYSWEKERERKKKTQLWWNGTSCISLIEWNEKRGTIDRREEGSEVFSAAAPQDGWRNGIAGERAASFFGDVWMCVTRLQCKEGDVPSVLHSGLLNNYTETKSESIIYCTSPVGVKFSNKLHLKIDPSCHTDEESLNSEPFERPGLIRLT